MKTTEDIKKEIMEQYKIKFNEVLNRMYNLEIVPDIQMTINERIPQSGGFRLFQSDELEKYLSGAHDHAFAEWRKGVTIKRKRRSKHAGHEIDDYYCIECQEGVKVHPDEVYGYNNAVTELHAKLEAMEGKV